MLVVTNSSQLYEERCQFERKMCELVTLVNEQTSCHQAIAESLAELKVLHLSFSLLYFYSTTGEQLSVVTYSIIVSCILYALPAWSGFLSAELRSLGLHSKVVDLMEALYTDTCSCVCADGVLSDWFTVGSGVRQGCRIAPDLFLEPMDHVMERTTHRGMAGVTLGNEVFTDLDFADDVTLLAERSML